MFINLFLTDLYELDCFNIFTVLNPYSDDIDSDIL